MAPIPIRSRARASTVATGAMMNQVDAGDTLGLSFEAFFRNQYRSVVGLAALLCGSRSIAEDLAQEAFVAAHRRWEHVCRYDDPAAWVRRVVVNLAVSARRRKVREFRALARLGRVRRPSSPEIGADAEGYWAAVRALPRRQAQCVTLRHLEDRSIEEIATILELAASTVRVHLHHGRSTLARRLGEVEGIDDDA